MVQVEQRVVALHVLVQSVLQVPSGDRAAQACPVHKWGPMNTEPGAPSDRLLISHTPPMEPCPALSIPAACVISGHVVGGGGLGWAEKQ